MGGIDSQYWFPAKMEEVRRDTPFTWQGWIVFLSYIALIIAGSIAFINSLIDIIFFRGMLVVLTTLFVWICWKKGERRKSK